MTTHRNRLADETSPYLLQHAHNPVDWYPWGEEAFAKARAEDVPILLSVGYSACHWCHVMERESFENEQIAAIMNAHFVCIKVDREERPDIDAIYMSAVQLMTGQGGWPMTVFLTPDAKPFYGGTYFPPQDYHGRAGFPRVLAAISEAWRTRRTALTGQSDQLVQAIVEQGEPDVSSSTLSPGLLDRAFETLSAGYDSRNGGFGSAPKFPQPASLSFLLAYHLRSGHPEPLGMLQQTLWAMGLGGIFDQLGGGFHRYSTDATWLAPHFEKMLYDNAQLAQAYVRAFQVTGIDYYREVAEATLDYALREMTGPDGGFYSAQDADSEGEEGRFFVWSAEEIDAALPDAEPFKALYDVTPRGNWEGRNILHVVSDIASVAGRFSRSVEETARSIEQSRATLFALREHRVKPGLDDKALTSWNGLMLAAMAECGAALDRRDYVEAAIRAAEFLRHRMAVRDNQGGVRLLRTCRNGTAHLNAYLEDYAFAADGLLHLYAATFNMEWLIFARELADTMIAHFWDEESGGFFMTSDDHEKLIHRAKDWDDNATPSGNSVAADVLLKLATLTEDRRYFDRAETLLRRAAILAQHHPYSFGRLLGAIDRILSPQQELVIIGDLNSPTTREMLAAARKQYRPDLTIVQTNDPERDAALIRLFAFRTTVPGTTTAYLCENQTCKQPVTTAADLVNLL